MNKRWSRMLLIGLLILGSLGSLSASAEQGAEGVVILKVSSFTGFDKPVVVNLVDGTGANYLLVAEPENNWQYDMQLPAGQYTVEYVTVDDAAARYPVSYTQELSVQPGKSVMLKVKVSEPAPTASEKKEESATVQRKTLQQIVQDSSVTLVLAAMAACVYGAMKYRKEKRDYGK